MRLGLENKPTCNCIWMYWFEGLDSKIRRMKITLREWITHPVKPLYMAIPTALAALYPCNSCCILHVRLLKLIVVQLLFQVVREIPENHLQD